MAVVNVVGSFRASKILKGTAAGVTKIMSWTLSNCSDSTTISTSVGGKTWLALPIKTYLEKSINTIYMESKSLEVFCAFGTSSKLTNNIN